MYMFPDIAVRKEADVRRFFNMNILMNVEYCIQRTFPGEGLGFLAEQGLPMSGIPDYSFTENGYPRFFYRNQNTVEYQPRRYCQTIQQ